MSIKSFFKKAIPSISWKEPVPPPTPTELELQNKELALTLLESHNINNGLNLAAGELYRQLEMVRLEALTLLSVIAFQHGGELNVKTEYFQIFDEPGNENLRLKIKKQEDGGVKLVLVTEDEEEEDKTSSDEHTEK